MRSASQRHMIRVPKASSHNILIGCRPKVIFLDVRILNKFSDEILKPNPPPRYTTTAPYMKESLNSLRRKGLDLNSDFSEVKQSSCFENPFMSTMRTR